MGQKVNPIIFRLGNSNLTLSSWSTNLDFYSHLLSQDLEIRSFLSSLLKSKGVLLRSCKIRRSHQKLKVYLDLYFSYMLSKQAKFFWARSLFKTIKKKYSRVNRIKDIKNFANFLDTEEQSLQSQEVFNNNKKYISSISSKKRRKSFLSMVKSPFRQPCLTHKNRLFYFLVVKNKSETTINVGEENKIVGAQKKRTKSHYKNLDLIRLNFNKFRRLFVLKKFEYNFRNYNLHKYVQNTNRKKDCLNLLELNQNLCKSLQHFCGLEEVEVHISSNQLNYLTSFKFYQKKVYKELVQFQKNRDLQKYFVETLENLYFVLGCFGFGNAYLLSTLLIFLLENIRKQIFVAKFLQKSLQVLFQTLPQENLAIDGIKILIKGRFNKRRRTKKVVLQEGQISLQTIDTPIDYYQTQAITIYGSFGIKIWISKRQKSKI